MIFKFLFNAPKYPISGSKSITIGAQVSTHSQNRPDPIVLRPSGFKLLVFGSVGIAVGLGSVALGFQIFHERSGGSSDNIGTWAKITLLTLVGILFSLTGAYCVVAAILRKPVVMLDERGWTTTGIRGVTIPWEFVDTIGVLCLEYPSMFGSQKHYFLGVKPKSIERLLMRLSDKERKIVESSLRSGNLVGLVQEMQLKQKCDRTAETLRPTVNRWIALHEATLPPVRQ